MVQMKIHIKSNINDPVFTIGVASKMLSVSPETLRMYEREGLLISYRTRTGRRMYSHEDLDWILCIRNQIKHKKLNLAGIKRLLSLLPCWEINPCDSNKHYECNAFLINDKVCWQLDNTPCRSKKLDCYKCPVYRMAPKIHNLKMELDISLRKS